MILTRVRGILFRQRGGTYGFIWSCHSWTFAQRLSCCRHSGRQRWRKGTWDVSLPPDFRFLWSDKCTKLGGWFSLSFVKTERVLSTWHNTLCLKGDKTETRRGKYRPLSARVCNYATFSERIYDHMTFKMIYHLIKASGFKYMLELRKQTLNGTPECQNWLVSTPLQTIYSQNYCCIQNRNLENILYSEIKFIVALSLWEIVPWMTNMSPHLG